jgi:hypothetical protein
VRSGVVAARRIESIAADLVASGEMIIMAEETGSSDERVIMLPPGTIPAEANMDAGQALSRLKSLVDAYGKRD